MLEAINNVNNIINGLVWGPPLLILIVSVGIFLTFRLKWFQVFKVKIWFKGTFGKVFSKHEVSEGAITPLQAISTALAATVGTGNIIGVATAIASGGPGAIFWMWIAAFFGMMTKFSEIVLAIHFRKRNKHNEWAGGPMYFIKEGLGKKFTWLAIAFSLFGSFAAFGIGNMTQVHSMVSSLEALAMNFGFLSPLSTETTASHMFFKLNIGLIIAFGVGITVIGGLKRISAVVERLVPFMCLFYIVGSIIALAIHHSAIPYAFSLIFKYAFNFKAAAGGAAGYFILQAIRYGIARGIFSNEAGLGSASIAHASAHTTHPVKQGLWGIMEVFTDTLIVCTASALVILTSGVLDFSSGMPTLSGAHLSIAAFSVSFGAKFGSIFIASNIVLFAFSTILGWSLYGIRCFEFLSKGKGLLEYKMIFILCTVAASVLQLDTVWNVSDTLNGLMAIPNLIGLIALHGIVIKLTKEYLNDRNKQY
jgi:AGCS family alanine or glycine:cation symporter